MTETAELFDTNIDFEEDKEERWKRYREIVAKLRLIDDDFMSQVLNDNLPAVKCILDIVLDERDDLEVISAKTQVEYKSAASRSIKLDVRAEDADGKLYNIEIQRSDRGAGAKRARFHSSALDGGMLDKSQDFLELADTYVIFFTEKDTFGAGIAMYHVERKIEELDNRYFGDGSHIIYINGAYRDTSTLIGKLIHDFYCDKAGDMYLPPLAEKVRYYKEDEEGNGSMCRIVEEEVRRGEERGARKANIKTALAMIQKNMSFEVISEITGLSISEIEKLAEKHTA